MAVNKNKNHVWKIMTDMELLRSAGLYEKNLVTGQKVFKMTCFSDKTQRINGRNKYEEFKIKKNIIRCGR